jgi:hypothetical protein
MTTTAFTLLFLPACLAVPTGLALIVVAETLIERIGHALARPAVAEPDRRAAREARRPGGRRVVATG